MPKKRPRKVVKRNNRGKHAKPAGSSSKEAEKQKEASKATEPVKPAGPSFHRALAAVEAIADQKDGPTRKELERILKEVIGIERGVYFQEYTGNQVRKLLESERVGLLWDLLPVTPQTTAYRRVMNALRSIQDVSKACTLTAAEQDQHENTILHFCEQTAIADLEETVTEKLHILSKHVTPFVRRFGTWCKMSEQAIAAAHAVSKEKKKGNNKLAPSLMCELALRGKMLIGY